MPDCKIGTNKANRDVEETQVSKTEKYCIQLSESLLRWSLNKENQRTLMPRCHGHAHVPLRSYDRSTFITKIIPSNVCITIAYKLACYHFENLLHIFKMNVFIIPIKDSECGH